MNKEKILILLFSLILLCCAIGQNVVLPLKVMMSACSGIGFGLLYIEMRSNKK